MNLKKKKKLAARVLGVGVDRIILVSPEEIKEAITRQDMIDLKKSGLIKIKNVRGTRKIKKRKTRRRKGSVKQKVKTRKEDYVRLTRKLRAYIKNLREGEKISKQDYYNLRKNIKTKAFRSLTHLIETLKERK